MTYGDCVAYLYPIFWGHRHVKDDGASKLTVDSHLQNITSNRFSIQRSGCRTLHIRRYNLGTALSGGCLRLG